MKFTCKQCNEQSMGYKGKKYCSKVCYTKSMIGVDTLSTCRGRRSYTLRPMIECKECNCKFTVAYAQRHSAKYCSKRCMKKNKRAKVQDMDALRNSERYKQWRLAIYKRDGFSCQSCKQVGKNLNAHHIVPVVINLDKIFDLNNGITLCKECHKLVHKNYKPKRKQGELLGSPKYRTISSQAKIAISPKVQRLDSETQEVGNESTSALPEINIFGDEIVRAN